MFSPLFHLTKYLHFISYPQGCCVVYKQSLVKSTYYKLQQIKKTHTGFAIYFYIFFTFHSFFLHHALLSFSVQCTSKAISLNGWLRINFHFHLFLYISLQQMFFEEHECIIDIITHTQYSLTNIFYLNWSEY